MEDNKQHTAELLNKLVEINNDRIEGYEKAISLLVDEDTIDVQGVFEKYRDQSIQFKSQLKPLVFRAGDTPTDETRTSGKLFRTWMSVKSIVAPYTIKSVLESCERGEDEFKKVYSEVIADSVALSPDILTIVQSQAALQLAAHDHIKALRDDKDIL